MSCFTMLITTQSYTLAVLLITIQNVKYGHALVSYNRYSAFRVKTLPKNYELQRKPNSHVHVCHRDSNYRNIISNKRETHILNAQTKNNKNTEATSDNYIDSTYSMYEQPKQKRKVKKNRYSKFSKVSQDEDPLDKLLAESKQKNTELKEGKTKKTKDDSIQTDTIRKRNEMTFPPLPTIDPYDPTVSK